MLGNCAKSLKILLVCDVNTLNAERMGKFGDVVKQVKKLFPKITLVTETRLIVTKCDEEDPQSIYYSLLD